MFIAALFTSQTLETTKMSINRINKLYIQWNIKRHVFKKKKPLIYPTTQMNFIELFQKKKSDRKERIYCMILFIEVQL